MKKMVIVILTCISALAFALPKAANKELENYFRSHTQCIFLELQMILPIVSAKEPLSPAKKEEICFRFGSMWYLLMTLDDMAFDLKLPEKDHKRIKDIIDIHYSLQSFCSMPVEQRDGPTIIGKDRQKFISGLKEMESLF